MKKLLASFLCFSLLCGMGISITGCKKGDEKKGGDAAKKDAGDKKGDDKKTP